MISVIFVAQGNSQNFLSTLQSLVSQKNSSFELLIVTESPKSHGALLSALPSIDFVLVACTPGASNAERMNIGQRRTRGNYLLFLNEGDLLLNEHSLADIEQNLSGEELVVFDILIKMSGRGFLQRRYPKNFHKAYWLVSDVCHQACVYSKKFFEDVGSFNSSLEFAFPYESLLKSFYNKQHRWKRVESFAVVHNLKLNSSPHMRRREALEKQQSQKQYIPFFSRALNGRRLMLSDYTASIRFRFLKPLFEALSAPLRLELRCDQLPLDNFLPKLHETLPSTSVLLVNTYEKGGGAAVATRRLFEGLMKSNIDAKMLVLHCDHKKPGVYVASYLRYPQKLCSVLLASLQGFLGRFDRAPSSSSLRSAALCSWVDLLSEVKRLKPQVLHLNWVLGGLASLRQLRELSRLNIKVVWTFHDMWPLCSTEHVSLSNSFESQYTQNGLFDFSALVWRLKRHFFKNLQNWKVVVPSAWMKNCVAKSTLFSRNEVYRISHGLVGETYKPLEMQRARECLGLPLNKKVILLGAVDVTSDGNKGHRYAVEALELLAEQSVNDTIVCVIGNCSLDFAKQVSQPVVTLGYLGIENLVSLAYSCADVFLVPSELESFGQMAMESLACGTPVVCFDTSGLKDVVSHKKSGYLAECYSTEDLHNGLNWVLKHANPQKLRQQVLLSAKDFSMEECVYKHVELYASLLGPERLEAAKAVGAWLRGGGDGPSLNRVAVEGAVAPQL